MKYGGIVYLFVVVPFIGTQSVDIYTSVGPPTTLSIEVGGKPLPEVQWFKDGNPTVHRTLADGSLYIEKTSVSDAGTYTARVTNAAGKSEESIHVTVVEPSPPEGNNWTKSRHILTCQNKAGFVLTSSTLFPLF